MKKTDIYVFQKVTSLAPFYQYLGTCVPAYAKEDTTVNLVLTFGRSENGTLIAKINCPVNPLPVKGEFRPASKQAVLNFLRKDGWEYVKSVGQTVLNM